LVGLQFPRTEPPRHRIDGFGGNYQGPIGRSVHFCSPCPRRGGHVGAPFPVGTLLPRIKAGADAPEEEVMPNAAILNFRSHALLRQDRKGRATKAYRETSKSSFPRGTRPTPCSTCSRARSS
jgi:hypothetical protein